MRRGRRDIKRSILALVYALGIVVFAGDGDGVRAGRYLGIASGRDLARSSAFIGVARKAAAQILDSESERLWLEI